MEDDVDDPQLLFRCKFCDTSFSSRKDCIGHEKACDKFIVIPQDSPSSASKPARETTLPPTNKITCRHCFKEFTLRKNCLRHERLCGPGVAGGQTSLPKFTCELCGSTTNRKDNHNSHVKKCKERHEEKAAESLKEDVEGKGEEQNTTKPLKDKKFMRSKTPCLFSDCDEEFFHKESLIDHLKNCHDNVKVEDPISKKFSSINEFHQWKDEEQERTFSYFSQKSGQQASKIKYFYCQHDGGSKSKRKTSRINFKGRVKVGHYCIAKMSVWKDSEGSINVLYFPTHSHVCSASDFVHHPLSKKDDLYINERIAWGVSPSKILRDVQKRSIPNTSSPQDIQNCKAFIINKKRIRERARKRREKRRYHKDEAKALFLLVNKLKAEEDCVILYKPYGQDVSIGPEEINSLPDHKELFMIGIQTKRQAHLLANHCHKVVLVDETHGTNHHKFQLLSLMIVDDNRRGWPVAHLITSRSDAETLQYFFKAVKQNAPAGVDLNLNCVISDDDPALINGIDLGFAGTLGALRHILCKWHLLRAFKKNLVKHVPRNMVDDMMTELRILINETDQTVFSNLQAGFIAKYEKMPQCKSFIDYYRKYYQKRVEKWAMCHRNFPHANINTTGHIESFHHRLKKSYLKRKVNRRLDDLIIILLDIEWDDHLTRIRESVVGSAFQPQEILMRHKRGMALSDDGLMKVDENTWDCKASTGKDVYYIVRYNEVCPSDHCFSKCSQIACSGSLPLCAHMYSCSCKDNNPLCKHVHKLHSLLTRHLVKQVRDNENTCEIAVDDFPPNEEKPILPEVTVNESEHRRTLTKNIQELEDNLSHLSEFYSSSKGKQNSLAISNAISHAAAVTKELVLQLQYMSEDAGVEDISEMEPAIRFNSNEKLKTQVSQVLPFKKAAKRKKKVEGVSPSKKRAVVKDLLSVLQSCNADVKFTPPLSFVSDPSDIILKCRNENISLLNLKSLEHKLPSDELMACVQRDPAFHVGWLYSCIINAYVDCLEEKYPSVLSLPSDFAWRASHGRSNSSYLGRKLEGTKKDVLLFPANLSGNHWCIIAVFLDLSQVWYYDPLQGRLSPAMEALLFQVCADLMLLFPKSDWETVVYVQAVKQTDFSSCGAYICSFAEQMARKSRPYVTHSNINAFRKDIYNSIVGECLKREVFDSEQCGVCSKDFSGDSEIDGNVWISCSKCEQWYHQSCVGQQSAEFVCPTDV